MPSNATEPDQALRLSRDDSRRFAFTLAGLIERYRLGSRDDIFPNVKYDRSTIHRWLTGRISSIPVAGATAILQALREYAPHIQGDPELQQLDDLIRTVRSENHLEIQLRSELRKRRVPVDRAIEAFRAVSALPAIEQHYPNDRS